MSWISPVGVTQSCHARTFALIDGSVRARDVQPGDNDIEEEDGSECDPQEVQPPAEADRDQPKFETRLSS